MEIVWPDVKLFNEKYDANNPEEVYTRLEKIMKMCYQSEGLAVPKSDGRIINVIFEREYWSILENHAFVMEVSSELYSDFSRVEKMYES